MDRIGPADNPTAVMRSILGRAYLGLFLVLSLLPTSGTVASQSIDLTPEADTALLELDPDFNLGAQTDLPCGTLGPSAGNTRSRILIRFDLTTLPAGARIESATLLVTVTRQPLAPVDSTFALHRMLKPWTEGRGNGPPAGGSLAQLGEPTWDAQSTGADAWAAGGGLEDVDYSPTISGTERIQATGPYAFEINAAGLVDLQDWQIEPSSNHGWILLSQAEATPMTARRFTSREALSNPPTLRLVYSLPPTGPRLVDLNVLPDATVLAFEAGPNTGYAWEESSALLTPNWLEILTIPPDTEGGLLTATNFAPRGSTGYIRLRVIDSPAQGLPPTDPVPSTRSTR